MRVVQQGNDSSARNLRGDDDPRAFNKERSRRSLPPEDADVLEREGGYVNGQRFYGDTSRTCQTRAARQASPSPVSLRIGGRERDRITVGSRLPRGNLG